MISKTTISTQDAAALFQAQQSGSGRTARSGAVASQDASAASNGTAQMATAKNGLDSTDFSSVRDPLQDQTTATAATEKARQAILGQNSTALLAQANLDPERALSLLQ
jgi:hypothetical protein